MIRRTQFLLVLGVCLVVGGLALLSSNAFPAFAQAITPTPMPYAAALQATLAAREASPDTTAEPVATAAYAAAADSYCLLCHRQANQVWVLASGETLNVTLDVNVIINSVHGEADGMAALACADCHPNWRYPHRSFTVRNLREFREERYAVCQDCHEVQYERMLTSAHGELLADGHVETVTCADCHGGHDVQSSNEPRARVTQICGSCHTDIFNEYTHAAHSLTPTGEGDDLVCTDCHGVHDIGAPNTRTFRNRAPGFCADCHVDGAIVGKADNSD